ncbi:SDR family NAD(P)-dependent oxidoreductase [Conexibacter arvalis]|uniref:NAD(P)-dependent dehydrogenase (Short-subunit alcohol dehydrogenase family) n=1 Tax=Conexibacter arvalis TaxID=912552 RepID=A0A840I8R7_9ACTN|nr:SDR family NAD(P)-dependent oxidoreductase [Conexibacter arvalis]MBB4660643.1 NAD(P)-dependent dehydrogenase (short-subunit alcohol dehydrogenase family) [Conexibacter arvalis]
MTVRFDGRVALVTGAGRGIGREHALELAARGAAVVVNDLGGGADGSGADAEPAHEVAAAIRAAGGRAIANLDSVATPEGAAAIVAAAVSAFGRLDMVVNNAGITLGDWPTMVDVHLSGTFYVCRAAWPLMVAQGGGRIVNTTSAAGLFGLTVDGPHGLDFFAYGAAKMGIVGLTRGLAIEGRPHGIRVNAISPVAHSRLTAWYPDPRVVAWMERHFPAAKVAPAVAALLHDDCPLSGETFSVGGGRIARVFVGETPGVSDVEPTAERVLAQLDDVTDTEGFFVPVDTADEMRAYRDLLVRRTSGS